MSPQEAKPLHIYLIIPVTIQPHCNPPPVILYHLQTGQHGAKLRRNIAVPSFAVVAASRTRIAYNSVPGMGFALIAHSLSLYRQATAVVSLSPREARLRKFENSKTKKIKSGFQKFKIQKQNETKNFSRSSKSMRRMFMAGISWRAFEP